VNVSGLQIVHVDLRAGDVDTGALLDRSALMHIEVTESVAMRNWPM